MPLSWLAAQCPRGTSARRPAVTLHPADYLSLGADACTGSLTTDGQENVYMAVSGRAEVLEFNPAGLQVGKVMLPASAPRVTHVATEPGTSRAFVTASGPGGRHSYAFQALASASANVPNGG